MRYNTRKSASQSLDLEQVQAQLLLWLPRYSDDQLDKLTHDLYFDCRAVHTLLPGQALVLHKRLSTYRPHKTMDQLAKLAREAPNVLEMKKSLEAMRYKLSHPDEFQKRKKKRGKVDAK